MDKSWWNEDKTNGALWGAGAVAALLVIGGSYWPGWQFDGTAAKSVKNAEKAALVRVLAPVCAKKFQKQPNLAAEVVAFKKVDSWERDVWLLKKGRVILSGDDSTDRETAHACANELTK